MTIKLKDLLNESPRMETIKKNKVKLTDEERDTAMKAGAVWHNNPAAKDGVCCAIWKAVINGKTWYGCNTHRAGAVKPTLKGAIKSFEFIKTTS